jgi:hypothetical protein
LSTYIARSASRSASRLALPLPTIDMPTLAETGTD